MLLELRLDDFLHELSSKASVPGGGSVSAVTGAMAAALISMVCNLTTGNKEYADVEERIKGIVKKSENLRDELSKLIDKDADAFSDVIHAIKMPQETEEDKVLRHEAIQHALQKAALVPLKTMELSKDTLLLAREVAECGSTNTISDAGVAAILADAAIKAAKINVDINLASIEDAEFTDKIAKKCDDILAEIDGVLEECLEIVERKIYS